MRLKITTYLKAHGIIALALTSFSMGYAANARDVNKGYTSQERAAFHQLRDEALDGDDYVTKLLKAQGSKAHAK